jgi:hypothetical protein
MDDMSQMGGIDMLRDHLTGKKLREKRQKRDKRENSQKEKGQRSSMLPPGCFVTSIESVLRTTQMVIGTTDKQTV